MERIIELEKLYCQIQHLIGEKNDIEIVQKQLGVVHLRLLERDLLNKTNIKDIYGELEVYNKIAFYLLTKLSNYKHNREIELQGFETAAFCFEELYKSKYYDDKQEVEYCVLSSICYSLAENQPNSVVMAKIAFEHLDDNRENIMYLYALFLAREFKKIININVVNQDRSEIGNAVCSFSKSMIYENDRKEKIRKMEKTLEQIRREKSEEYYFFRLIFLVSKKMNEFSIRNLISRNPELEEYIDVLTQKEMKNIYELWSSQYFLMDKINEIKNVNTIFMLSLPTSAGKTLVSELMLFEFLSNKIGLAIYVVPSIALINEIENCFIKRFRKVGISIVKELEFDEDSDINEPTILILTPEKLDLLTRKNEEVLTKLECIVFDEFHKVSDGQRGWLEETLMAWFIFNKNKYSYKIIMMSAIIDDLEESLTDINAFIHIGKWTPAKKIYGMFYLPKEQVKVYGNDVKKNDKIEEQFSLKIKYEKKLQANISNIFQRETYGKVKSDGKDCNKSDTKYDLCWKAINSLNETPILVYFLMKKDIKSFINRCNKYCKKSDDLRLKSLRKNIERQLGKSHPLIKALEYGVAFHNGDLPEDVRSVIESAYKNKLINILACTTTLADGVNMPVSTLVVGNVFNYDYEFSLSKGDYKNIVGRIGRALVDTEGKIFLIKYPEYYKDDVTQTFMEYYNGEEIKNKLISAFETIDENDLELVEIIGLAELENEKKDLKAMIQRIQVFVFSMYEKINQSDFSEFQKQYDNSFFLKISPNRKNIINNYISNYYGLAKSISFDFLKKCNMTGVSYESNLALSKIADYIFDSNDIYEVLTEEIYTQLLECDEFLPDEDIINHYGVLQSWLSGDSYFSIREQYFGTYNNVEKSTEKCSQYIRKIFQYIVPWALSALGVYIEDTSYANNVLVYLIRCMKYGTLKENVVALCESGIKSRELAIDLNNIYDKEISTSKDNITEWVVNVQKQKLEEAFGNKFDKYVLEQISKYRSIKRKISNYFENSNAIKCRVMGLKHYDYNKMDIEYFEVDKEVIIVQDFNNEYDMYAVKIMTFDFKYMLGYVPMKCSEEIFDLIESGCRFKSSINISEPNNLYIRIENLGI